MPPKDFGGLLEKSKSVAAGPALAIGIEPVEDEEPDDEAADPKIERLKPIAQDLIDAIKAGDATAVAESWLAYGEAMGMEPEAEPEEAEGLE